MNITPATDAHLQQIETLYLQSVRANKDGFVQNLNFHGNIKEFIKSLQKDNGIFAVGLQGDQVVAIGGLRRLSGQIMELCKLHVDAACQGLGYGRAMCQYLLDYAAVNDIKKIELHVTTSQHPAISLYKKLEFTQDRTEIWEAEFEQQPLAYETLYMSKDLSLASPLYEGANSTI